MSEKNYRDSVHNIIRLETDSAAFANRNNSLITIENENSHQFAFGNANPAGSLLRFRQGVRCLTVEAGWTRTPTDGFMRGGALAVAKISYFDLSFSSVRTAR